MKNSCKVQISQLSETNGDRMLGSLFLSQLGDLISMLLTPAKG